MNKTIWMYWRQGWEMAPPLVRACAESWRRLNPAWRVTTLTAQALREDPELVGKMPAVAGKALPDEALSDVIRLHLLDRHGGIWADATTYCMKPLDDWIPEVLSSGFFAFDRPGPWRMLSTWFLAADAPCPIVHLWRLAADRYWTGRDERDNYFWAHILFAQAYEQDAQVRALWDATPKISADGPHCAIPYAETLLGPPSEQMIEVVRAARWPMLKLTHKLDWPETLEGTFAGWLIDRLRQQPDRQGRLES